MQRLAIVVVVFIVVVAGISMFLLPKDFRPQSGGTGTALIGGAFSAIDHQGNVFTDKDLLGQYSLVYFGFTHCPDICPTGLLTLAGVLDSLPTSLNEKLLPIFVTVDPKRDTQEVMASYVSNFHPALIGLTGTEEQIKQIADAYKVYYQVAKQEGSQAGYVVDHSGYFYLMDKEGRYLKHFPHNISEQSLAAELRAAID